MRLFFAILAKFWGKINLANEIIMYINMLDMVAAGLIGAWTTIFSTNSRKSAGG